MDISLIVAMARNRAIGLDGKMPWHIPEDLQNFKKITMGAPIVMGRKTFESIGRPLPGRTNIIVSSAYTHPDCEVVNSLDDIPSKCFVIGGATLYEALLPRANTLYITKIHRNYMGDTFFPQFDKSEWAEVSRDDRIGYSFLKYERKA
jgi:dihydrofolate reductase